MYEQIITEEHARDIALQEVPGDIQKVGMDLEYGIIFYKFTILTEDDKRFKVLVNARSGQVIGVREKSVD